MRLAVARRLTSIVLVAGCTTAGQAALDPSPDRSQVELERSQPADANDTPRQLVRRGQLDVTVEQLANAQHGLERAAAALGAQVAKVDVNERERAEYHLRVPADRLVALMDSAASLGKAGRRTVSAEDVTAQSVDLEARVAALRASRDRLRQLMERSASVSDVVAVEHELSRVQGELDSLEGRLALLKGQVTMSELTVRLQQRHVLGPLGLIAVGAATLIGKLFVWR